MNIFKKIFRKKEKKEEQQEECWYNKDHEKGEAAQAYTGGGASLGGVDMAVTKTIARK